MFGRKGDERTKGITQRKGRNGERITECLGGKETKERKE
jgi:hypothetical protein